MLPLALIAFVVDPLSTSDAQRPEAVALLRRLLKTHDLRPYPRLPESKMVF